MTFERVTPKNLRAFLSIRIDDAQKAMLHASNFKTYLQSVWRFWYARLYLIRHQGENIGYILLYCIPEYGKYNIGRLVIDTRFQRMGFGKAALLWGARQLKDRGAKRALLSVHPDNAAAIRLYEGAGFAFTGGFWGEEAVMALPLI